MMRPKSTSEASMESTAGSFVRAFELETLISDSSTLDRTKSNAELSSPWHLSANKSSVLERQTSPVGAAHSGHAFWLGERSPHSRRRLAKLNQAERRDKDAAQQHLVDKQGNNCGSVADTFSDNSSSGTDEEEDVITEPIWPTGNARPTISRAFSHAAHQTFAAAPGTSPRTAAALCFSRVSEIDRTYWDLSGAVDDVGADRFTTASALNARPLANLDSSMEDLSSCEELAALSNDIMGRRAAGQVSRTADRTTNGADSNIERAALYSASIGRQSGASHNAVTDSLCGASPSTDAARKSQSLINLPLYHKEQLHLDHGPK